MREIRHDSATPAEGIRFFDFMRDELTAIRRAIVVLAQPGNRVGTSSLLIRDTHGDAIVLTGWQDATHVQRTRAAARILGNAGFARERAEIVYTHRIVRLTRTPDGATSIEQAMGFAGPDRSPSAAGRVASVAIDGATRLEATIRGRA